MFGVFHKHKAAAGGGLEAGDGGYGDVGVSEEMTAKFLG